MKARRQRRGGSRTTQPPPPEQEPLIQPAWICLALVCLNLLIYAQVRHHEFLNWDDPEYVSANPYIAGGLTWKGVSWALTTGHAANWHPVTWMSHMLDIQIFGLSAGPHLLTNVALHSANTVLLFLVLFQMTRAVGRSAFVAALFASHPLHVESVAWISERKDVLSTLFWMLTIWTYLAYVRKPQVLRYLLVVVVFGVGLMAKPMLVTLPFVLLLLDAWPLRRARVEAGEQRAWLRLAREKLPLIALAVASSIVTFIVQRQGGAVSGLASLPLGTRAANAAVAYLDYIAHMLWPARLAVVYPYVLPLSPLRVAGAVAGLAGITFVVLRARRHLYLPVGWLWYVGTLVPVIGLVQVGSQPMADRYTYVPLIGLFIIAAWGLPDLAASWKLPRVMTPISAVLAIAVCATMAYGQVQHWTNNVTLWSHALAVTSNNSRAHNNLGNALSNQGKSAEAMAHYTEALRINPAFVEALTNRGNGLAAEGKTGAAIESYRAALRVAPRDTHAHNGLGSALDDQGQVDEAIAEYAEAIRIDPAYAPAHNNMGAALFKQGKLPEAVREFGEAVRWDPGIADYHYNLGAVLERTGRSAEAARQLEAALQLNPRHQGARRGLDAIAGRKQP